MILIGISGKARAGKDTVAGFLHKVCYEQTGMGLPQISFAEKIKSIATDLFGWDGSKELLEQEDQGRKLLINLGNKMREIRSTVWVDYVVNNLDKFHANSRDVAGYVVADVRFKNEAQIIKNAGGFLIRVERPGKQLDIDDPTETDCDDVKFDYVIHNNNEGLDNMLKEVYKLYEALKERYSLKRRK